MMPDKLFGFPVVEAATIPHPLKDGDIIFGRWVRMAGARDILPHVEALWSYTRTLAENLAMAQPMLPHGNICMTPELRDEIVAKLRELTQ